MKTSAQKEIAAVHSGSALQRVEDTSAKPGTTALPEELRTLTKLVKGTLTSTENCI